eukprot:COSAG01_NODE_34287_length_550_cov_0.884701_1_plen_59_part_10
MPMPNQGANLQRGQGRRLRPKQNPARRALGGFATFTAISVTVSTQDEMGANVGESQAPP